MDVDVNNNNLVKEIYPEQVKYINPYDISYIAMKNGSIIMLIEKTPSKYINNYYVQHKEQNSPTFNIKGKKYSSYVDMNKNNLEENPYIIEKRKYIFYKKTNNKEKEEKMDKKLFKHSKTFSYSTNTSNTTPIKKPKNFDLLNKTSIRKNFDNNNNEYNNIAIKLSRYSSKKRNSKTPDSIFSYGFIKSNSEIINITPNLDDITYSDDYYDYYNKPKIEFSDDYAMSKYSVQRFDNHTVVSNYNMDNNKINIRPKTPEYSMRNLGKKNHKKNNKNNLELKKCLSKHNHRYYERKEISAPKKYKSNYIRMKSFGGNTIHVFENK